MADRNLELALRIRTIIQGAEGVDDLRQGMNGLADEIEQAGQGAQDAGQQFDNLEDATSRAGEGANKAKKPMDELKGVLAGIVTLAAAKEILDLNDRLTGIKRGFETVTGSAEASDRALVFVNDTAKRLGTNALDLAQAFLKITASAKGTQLEGAPTEKIFSSIASAMTTVNASGEDLERVMDAVGQMMGKGVVSAEELRGQLGDSLPGAVQQAAQALMVSNAELSKMLESGEVIAADFLPKFAEQLEKSMGGGGKQVESFTASWNRLVNQLVEIATGPTGQGFTLFVATLVDKLAVLTRGVGFASDAIGSLGRLMGGIAAGEFGEAFKDFGQSVEDASIHLMGAKTAAEQATEQQKQMAAELAALTPALDKFQDAVARKDLKALPEYLQAAIAEFKKTGDAAATTEQAISKFMAAPAQNLSFDGLLNLATSIKAVAQDAKGAGDQIASTLGAQLAKLTNEQLTALEAQARKAMAAASGDDAARKAFADLGQVIEGAVLARFERLGVDGKEALTGISDAATKAIEDFTALATNVDLSADIIEKAFEGALAKLDSPEEIEKLKQEIIELGNSGKLTGEQVERALLLIRQRAQETANDAAFNALADQLAKIREEADREAEASTRATTIKQAQIEATRRLAEAKGDEAAAARASADAAETEVEAARERADQITREIELTKQHIQQLYARATADGQYSDAERDVIETLKEKVGQLDLERQKIEANLPLQERQAQQAAILAGPIGQLSRLYAEQTKEHQRAADASEQYYSVQLKEIEGAIKVAQARGDEAEAAKLQAKQQKNPH
jgi:tape measure domain-containing protein